MAALRIEQDHNRFRQIVRGKVKADLKKYISHEELIGRKGKDLISIPVPQIDIPTFRFSPHSQGGVGQGDGEAGTPIAAGEGEDSGEAGNVAGEHLLEVDITLEELAQILGEELELPKILPKGTQRIQVEKDKYSAVRRTGPESLRHFKRTYKEALKRQITSGVYNDRNPIILPIREDKRYLSWKTKPRPECNALIVHMMDVSGSMGEEQKEIVRIETFWIDTWLRSQYKGLVTRYIVHDATAKEVSEEQFYHIRESGGTMISSAYNLFNNMVDEEYDLEQWNVYGFHFSDGDNWSGGDTDKCVALLEKELLPKVNLFCYGQVESAYGSGEFLKELDANFSSQENLVTSRIQSKDSIYASIKDFLGKGK
jgi:sporulation protein YhbH